MKDSATEATESARSACSDFGAGCLGDTTRKTRCADEREKPSVEARGLGHGIRAFAEDIVPSCRAMG